MASFSMQINLDGAGFTDEDGEVSEIAVAQAIQRVARQISRNLTASGVVIDDNGNNVGTFDIEGVGW